jgi:hypothetical protein
MPNSSASKGVSTIAAQFTATNGRADDDSARGSGGRRALCRCRIPLRRDASRTVRFVVDLNQTAPLSTRDAELALLDAHVVQVSVRISPDRNPASPPSSTIR